MKYQTYPAYKDSGVEWLGDVPEHWTNAPIKYMALEECSLFLDGDWIESKDLSDEGIRYITTGNIGEGIYKEQGAGYITEDKFETLNCTEVFEGDILISRLNLPIGRSCIVPNLESRIITSVDNVIFRPDSRYSKNYLVYLFSSEGYFKHTGNVARGTTMQRISRGLLGNIRVIVPTLSEQQKIAQFLDHETAKIDTLIEKQQRLIELLKEKRQAVISHAVTKGLNPNAPMKDSGVEWLGDVPEHWVVNNITYIFNAIGDVDHYMPQSVENGIPYVMTGDLKEFVSGISFKDCKQVSHEDYVKLSQKIKSSKGDLIVARYATIGTASYVDIDTDFLVSYSCVTIKPNPSKVFGLYLFYYFKSNSFLQGIQNQINTNTQGNVGISDLKKVKMALPTLDEQSKIIEFLDKKVSKVDTLIEKSNSAIELMQERRTALISAAVTGKIDVRDWGD
jgi:type I restriction enzyme S subunit